ncbi:MAG: hypothetical protein R3B07_24040 [Polyangiaceae bacterium]
MTGGDLGPSSADVFRRRLSAGKPKFGLAFALHGLFVGFLLYAFLGRERFGPGLMARLFSVSLVSVLCWIGIVATCVTAVLGLRLTKEGLKPRWRWPLLLPPLVLVALQMFVFARGTELVSAAGDAAPLFGGSLFMLSALAISGVAGVACIGFGFAACTLSLAGWIFALCAQRDTQGAAIRMRAVPVVLVLVVGAVSLLIAPIGDLVLVLGIAGFGAIALFQGRAAGSRPTAVRDLVFAGICLGGACVLAGLSHFNQVLSLATGRGDDVIERAYGLGESIDRANTALSAAWLVASGFLVGAVVTALGRRGELAHAFRLSITLLIASLLCIVMPWAGAKVQLSRAISKLETASAATVPSGVELPEVPDGSLAQAWFGEPWLMGTKETKQNPSATPSQTSGLSAADCEAFAKRVVTGGPFGRTAGAIDKNVEYTHVHCVLTALAAETRAGFGDRGVGVLGKAKATRPLPRVFRNVQLPPAAVSVFPDARGWDAEQATYIHIDASGNYRVNQGRPQSLDGVVAGVQAEQEDGMRSNVLAVSAEPNATWGSIFALAVSLPRHMVVLGPPDSKGQRFAPARDPESELDSESQRDGARAEDDESEDLED